MVYVSNCIPRFVLRMGLGRSIYLGELYELACVGNLEVF